MVRIEVHGQRLARIRMDGESLGDWQIRGEGILGRRCLGGTVSTPKGHRQSVRTGDVNRDWIIGRIRELEASAQARVVTRCLSGLKYRLREFCVNIPHECSSGCQFTWSKLTAYGVASRPA